MRQYVSFCKISDEQRRLYGSSEKAAQETVRICLEQDILVPFLTARRQELVDMRMYCCSLRNKPDATQKDRVPVELPKDQFLDPNTLDALMVQAVGGDLS